MLATSAVAVWGPIAATCMSCRAGSLACASARILASYCAMLRILAIVITRF